MAEKLLKSAAWDRLLIELKKWRLKQRESDMAWTSRPGIYSRGLVLLWTQTLSALARRVQIKSQISKGHLCAWLDNQLRPKESIGCSWLKTARVPASVAIHGPVPEKLVKNIAIFNTNINQLVK